jgi:uncharacterized membrane protein
MWIDKSQQLWYYYFIKSTKGGREMFAIVVSSVWFRTLVVLIPLITTVFWPKIGFFVAAIVVMIISLAEVIYAIAATPVYNVSEALRWAVLGYYCFNLVQKGKDAYKHGGW